MPLNVVLRHFCAHIKVVGLLSQNILPLITLHLLLLILEVVMPLIKAVIATGVVALIAMARLVLGGVGRA